MKHVLKIVLAMLIWGSIGVFVKNISLPSIEIVFLRAAVACIFLLLGRIILIGKPKIKDFKKSYMPEALLLIITGIILALNWLLLFQAYKYTTLTNATLSYYLAPVFVVLLSPVFFKEKITLKNLLAVILAMAGLALIVSHQAQGSSLTNYNHIKGIIFGISAAVLYASIVLVNKSVKKFSGFDKALIQISVSAIILLPIVLYRNSLHISDTKTLIIILILGIVHTAIAYVLYFSSIEHVSAQRASLLSYVDPLSAVIFGTLLLSEPLGIYHILGGALILISTFVSNK